MTSPRRNYVNTDDELARAALHESAHAFVLWRLGHPIDEVAVTADGHGHTIRAGDSAALEDEDKVAVLLAGEAGERLRFAEATGCDADFEAVSALLRQSPWMLPGLRATATALVREGRAAVTALAEALEKRQRIPGAAAAEIFARAAARTSPEAARAATDLPDLGGGDLVDAIAEFVGRTRTDIELEGSAERHRQAGNVADLTRRIDTCVSMLKAARRKADLVWSYYSRGQASLDEYRDAEAEADEHDVWLRANTLNDTYRLLIATVPPKISLTRRMLADATRRTT